MQSINCEVPDYAVFSSLLLFPQFWSQMISLFWLKIQLYIKLNNNIFFSFLLPLLTDVVNASIENKEGSTFLNLYFFCSHFVWCKVIVSVDTLSFNRLETYQFLKTISTKTLQTGMYVIIPPHPFFPLQHVRMKSRYLLSFYASLVASHFVYA
jgi:hypothetical protein